MRAKVKQDSRLSAITACAGVQFSKHHWTDVPPDRIAEALANPFLDIEVASSEPEAEETKPMITEAAEKLAAETGVDLSQVSGTGKDGLVTVADVRKAAKPEQGEPESEAEK